MPDSCLPAACVLIGEGTSWRVHSVWCGEDGGDRLHSEWLGHGGGTLKSIMKGWRLNKELELSLPRGGVQGLGMLCRGDAQVPRHRVSTGVNWETWLWCLLPPLALGTLTFIGSLVSVCALARYCFFFFKFYLKVRNRACGPEEMSGTLWAGMQVRKDCYYLYNLYWRQYLFYFEWRVTAHQSNSL